ncbi:MAG: hypothetical protein WD057_08615 [Aquisalimonadaceae bacterium]
MRIEHGEEEAGMKAPENNEKGVEARRKFLKTMAATGGAAAVALSAGTAVAGVREEAEPTASSEKHGYKETQHIKDYYAKASF